MRLLVAVAFAAAIGASVVGPASGPADAGPVEAGLAALHRDGADGPSAVLALVAAGEDPRAWHGRDLVAAVAVPPNGDAIAPLHEAYAVLAAGADPTAFDDPVRGPIDLRAQLQDNVEAVLASQDDAAASFQIIAMTVAGMPVPDAVRDHLLGLQHPSGAWGCGPWLGPECTGFALVALAASGGIPHSAREAAVAYLMGQFRDGPFDDPLNGPGVQVTAWAINGLMAADAEVPDDAWRWLRDQQGADGMWSSGGRPSAWATAEAIVTLSGGHPVGR